MSDLDKKILETFMFGQKPSDEFESRLFDSAEDLLIQRRLYLDSKKTAQIARAQVRRDILAAFFKPIQLFSDLLKFLAVNPASQAATIAVLVLVIVVLNKNANHQSLNFSDLPEFPKFNNAPASYDAQWLSERQAYEKEVEYAHQNTNGDR